MVSIRVTIFFIAVAGGWYRPKVDFNVCYWSCRYDSVTIGGELNWQDQLNEYNKPFFDICDGIFVNYTWTVLLIFLPQ